MSGTLAARLGVWRWLLIFGRSIGLDVCIDVFTNLEDRRVHTPEMSGIVSADWKTRELLWMLNQSLETGMRFVAQPVVVKQDVEFLGIGKICELVKRGIKARLGRYRSRGRTPNWAGAFECKGECADLCPARTRYFIKSCLWEVDGCRTEGGGARDDVISVVLQDERLRVIEAIEKD